MGTPRSPRTSLLALVVCVLLLPAPALLAGCGGAMRADELARSVEALGSAAAEGALIARDAADDRTKTTFVRARARELGETVEHEAEKLADADATGEVAEAKARAVDLADRISEALGRLQTSPDDAVEAGRSARVLTRLADEATRLAESA
jgi:hypothetical protein